MKKRIYDFIRETLTTPLFPDKSTSVKRTEEMHNLPKKEEETMADYIRYRSNIDSTHYW